jgi:hypothetical protein
MQRKKNMTSFTEPKIHYNSQRKHQEDFRHCESYKKISVYCTFFFFPLYLDLQGDIRRLVIQTLRNNYFLYNFLYSVTLAYILSCSDF